MKKSVLFKLVKEEWIKHKHKQALNEADSMLVSCQQDSSGGWRPTVEPRTGGPSKPMGGPNDMTGGPNKPMGGPNMRTEVTPLMDYDEMIYCKTTPKGLTPIVKGAPGLNLKTNGWEFLPPGEALLDEDMYEYMYENEMMEYYGCMEEMMDYQEGCGGNMPENSLYEAEKATKGKKKNCGNLKSCKTDGDCQHDGYSCEDGCCVIACKKGESDTECKARQKKSLKEGNIHLNNLMTERLKKLANIIK